MTSPFDTAKSAILGVPIDPNKKPSRAGIVQAFAEMQRDIDGAASGALVKSTLAALTATTTAPSAGCMAWVVGDATTANNGIYENIGTAVAATWARRTDIPQFFVSGINVGAGTANAIQVTTDLPVPSGDGRCIVALPIVTTNTSATVTVSINGGAALTVVRNYGTALAVGDLVAGVFYLGVIAGGKFRLINPARDVIETIPANGSVTNIKLADMPESTFKGRNSGIGTGAPQDLTANQAAALLASNIRTYARDVNPEYMFSKVFDGHEADADHTSLFNQAFAEVSAGRGGTIRFDAKEYRLASTPNAITTSGVYLKGVGSSGIGGAGGASQTGTVFRLTGTGTQNGITWGDNLGVTGYQYDGGGIEDIRFEARSRTGGYALMINRGRNFHINRIHMWEVFNGINNYGSFNVNLNDSTIEQIKGNRCVRFFGDAANRGDAFNLLNVLLTGQNAITGTRGDGILWEGFAHTLCVQNVKIVNPLTGVLIEGGAETDSGKVPHFGVFHDLEIDFAYANAIFMNKFKDMKFVNTYIHSFGQPGAYCLIATGSSAYGGLIFTNGRFSNAQTQLFIGCADVILANNIIGPTNVGSTQYIASSSDARRCQIIGNKIGTNIFGTGPASCVGVAMATGADKWLVANNQFVDIATPVQNFGTGALVNVNNQT